MNLGLISQASASQAGAGCVDSDACTSPASPSCSFALANVPLSFLPCSFPTGAEYVKERITVLRKQHPGQYQNASVVRMLPCLAYASLRCGTAAAAAPTAWEALAYRHAAAIQLIALTAAAQLRRLLPSFPDPAPS